MMTVRWEGPSRKGLTDEEYAQSVKATRQYWAHFYGEIEFDPDYAETGHHHFRWTGRSTRPGLSTRSEQSA